MSNPVTHDLKCWPEHYQAIVQNFKHCEVRLADRSYRVGDRLCLREFNPCEDKYTGRETVVVVTHILDGTTNGIDPDYVVMSIR